MRILCLLALAALLSSATPALAGSYFNEAGEKLVHGVGDVAYAPAELLARTFVVARSVDRDNELLALGLGLPLGVVDGTAHASIRVFRGTVRVATFWLGTPKVRRWEWFLGGHPDQRRVR